ncbi:uncharacterized protein LOC115623121 [Scaptodrosophila lebanonensis]|uniref:Uncharacterized protein LOC115623121 n=1 Tax=Drosophila lebanonensis TaxID=7225 RepID=A0A6J2TCS6_DROLE|nr:uncharacterized protein LOC115623121 [Scaptodrosophila lebanonensis]XP_030373189.1 uncharacterized protein LOC115623121 [Scaptodrosophila lebanonensis]XP_030373190.1 uncharacterized protein LOC115623121 [Scaptodrosophila lebanonensis]XP_030373191.1 uncharacterized protein LOC115623121 [Scaptodrosophila lebanonensis]
MALLLVHLRRLILLLSVVYLAGAVFRRLLTERHHAHMLQLGGGPYNNNWTSKPLHFQWWAYIYTCYAYVVLVNYVNLRQLTNLIEFLLS